MKIYLAGTYNQPEDEKRLREMKTLLEKKNHQVWWCKDNLGNNYGKTDGKTRKWVVETEKEAIKKSDVVVAIANRATPGTMMEIIFASENKIPVFVLTENPVLTESPWVHYHAKIVGSENALFALLGKA
ncbi:MAG: nucleoside 2-deoxyribosyltransferase [Candidatus Aenigmarchaeota archaeon]|nr:nucleoside 2-deoxyribosyltransferase [Candidatus Aenigmarchaeota archaeon]